MYKRNMSDIAKELMANEIHVAQLFAPLFFMMNAGVGQFINKKTDLVTAQIAGSKREMEPVTGEAVRVGKDQQSEYRPDDLTVLENRFEAVFFQGLIR